MTDLRAFFRARRDATFLIVFFSGLLAAYAFNAFKVAKQPWFETHQRDSEALVVGRLLVASSSARPFANAGFLCSIPDRGIEPGIEGTYRRFQRDEPLGADVCAPYPGQLGLQGHVFMFVDATLRRLGVGGFSRLDILHVLNAAALAALLAYLLMLFRDEFGLGAALVGLATLVLSPWLTVFARNLYWVPVTWFAPLVVAWITYVKNEPPRGKRIYWTAALIGGAILVKSLCGFEYVSAVVGAAGSAVLYGLIKYGRSLREIIIHMMAVAVASVSAVVIAIVLQMIILAAHLGGLAPAWQDFVFRVGKRTHGSPTEFPEVYADSLSANVFDVVYRYWSESKVVGAGSVIHANAAQIIAPAAFFIFVAGGVMLIRSWRNTADRRQYTAILALAAASAGASLSWFVLAKGHSYVHYHMNYVLWHVPFLLIALPICAYLFANLVRQRAWPGLVAALVAVIIGGVAARPTRALPFMSMDTERGRVAIMRAGILFDFKCSELSPENSFFVHLGSRPEYLPEGYKKSSVLNLDFSWNDARQDNLIYRWMTGRCRAFARSRDADLSTIPITYLMFGQYRRFIDGQRVWTQTIAQDRFSTAAALELVPADITDPRWTKGVHTSGKGFTVKNTLEHRQLLATAHGIIRDGQKVPFEEVTVLPEWINFFFEAVTFSPKGPRPIKLY